MDQQPARNLPLCDLCGAQRAVVYCKSDSARLCLACDVHVHSANMLSHRHLRSLICDECTSQPAAVRCIDDKKSLCVACQWADGRNGSSSSQGMRYQMNCYSGCPTLAEISKILAGSNNVGKGPMNTIDENACWNTSVTPEQANPSWMPNALLAGGSGSSLVPPPGVSDIKQESISQLEYAPFKDLNTICDDYKICEGVNTINVGLAAENNNDLFDVQSKFSFPDAEMDGMFLDKKFLDPTAPIDNPGEASSSVQPDQIRLQSGVNLMNSGNQDQMVLNMQNNQNGIMNSANQGQMVLNMQNNQNGINLMNDGNQDQMVLNMQNNQNLNMGFAPGYLCPNMSLSISNMTGESSVPDYRDCGVSPSMFLTNNSTSAPWESTDDSTQPRTRNEAKLRYNEKKKNRLFGKKIRYASRKARADTRKRVKEHLI